VNAANLASVEPELRACLEGSPDRDKVLGILREMHELVGGETVKRLSQPD
jgi:predicted aldo/keto reductase-like oxidoreductase